MKKNPFDIDLALQQVEEAVRPFPKAGLFELAEEGFGSPFELLVACIISIRTFDEVMLPCARRLLKLARTPLELSALTPEQIDAEIKDSTFHDRKAQQIAAIAQRIVTEYDGTLPCKKDVLLSFRGVGPKCANLVLGIAGSQPSIGVDIHVQRKNTTYKKEIQCSKISLNLSPSGMHSQLVLLSCLSSFCWVSESRALLLKLPLFKTKLKFDSSRSVMP
jgi:endonuclease-3